MILRVAILCVAFAAPTLGAEVPVEEDYILHCQACHGADGAGTPGVTPSLSEMGTLLARPGGRDYLLRVPGVAQAPLGDARLARLLGWVLERFAGVRPEPPFSPDEVASQRREPLRDTRSARAALFADPLEAAGGPAPGPGSQRAARPGAAALPD